MRGWFLLFWCMRGCYIRAVNSHSMRQLGVIFFSVDKFLCIETGSIPFQSTSFVWSLFGGSLPAHVIRFGQGAAGRCPTFCPPSRSVIFIYKQILLSNQVLLVRSATGSIPVRSNGLSIIWIVQAQHNIFSWRTSMYWIGNCCFAIHVGLFSAFLGNDN